MNYFKFHLFALTALTSMAHAQVSSETLDAEVDAEIENMYQAPRSGTNPQPFAMPTRPMVQRQPVTVIEASPLSSSSADSIRKSRQDEEMKTESRIVEKLEQNRMEDEKRRADVLFGDKFQQLNQPKDSSQAPLAQPAPVQVVEAAPAPLMAPPSKIQPIVIQQNDGLSRDDVHEEVRAALDAEKDVHDDSSSMFERRYFAALAGVAQYPDAQAIRANYSMGLAIGANSDYLNIEGGFIYSSFNLQANYVSKYAYANPYAYNNIYVADFNMNQFQTYLAAKYQLLAGTIRPTLGGLMSYSYRTYEAASYTLDGPPGTQFGTSNAIDLGVTAGIDIAMTERFSLGADFKYMFNVSANISGNTAPNSRSPEKMNYYSLGAVAKLGF